MRVSLFLGDFRPALGLLFGIVFGLVLQAPAAASEQLIVFTQPTDTSELARRFEADHLPAIRGTAEKMGVELRIVDVTTAGAPAEVAITPLMVHQSARGRSFFQGRYPDVGKLTNFIRTSRALPLTGTAEARDHIATFELGRGRVATPIKITPLAGEPPAGFDTAVFADEAEAAVLAGFEHLQMRNNVELGAADRKFYFDFHPYTADGQLFVSVAQFSQFHCIDSIFERFDQPFQGAWKDRAQVFAEAGRALERELLRQIEQSEIGDGFDSVPQATQVTSWQALGLELPQATAADIDIPSHLELPTRWRIRDLDPSQPPRLSFRFPSPLERYAGEVTDVNGRLSLSEDGSLHGAQGWIEAATSSVTMGETGLDRAIHQKMIDVVKFPAARFDLESLAADSRPMAFGQTTAMTAEGTFVLRGLKIPVHVKGDVEPIVGEGFVPQLRVRASFQIRLLDPFGLKGPDGPEPAKDTLVFYLDFLMEEEPKAS